MPGLIRRAEHQAEESTAASTNSTDDYSSSPSGSSKDDSSQDPIPLLYNRTINQHINDDESSVESVPVPLQHTPTRPILQPSNTSNTSRNTAIDERPPLTIQFLTPNPTQATATSTPTNTPDLFSIFNPIATGRTIKEHRNQQRNEHRNEHIGDELIEKPPDTTRIYVQNGNGFNTKDEGHQLRELFEDTKQIQADLRGVIEHNLDATNFEVRKICFDAARKALNQHAIEFGSSSIPFQTQYKPGGTMTIANGDIVGRITNQFSDPLGRWTTITMACRNNKLIHLITAYQVCPRPTHRTGTTAFHQQESLLRLQGLADINPRRNFRIDIIKYMKSLETPDSAFILAGDFNEPLVLETSNTSKISQALSLVDVMQLRHPTLDEPATHIRGSKRIDYFLISESLLPSVQACGYDAFNFRLHSDHRGMFLDLHTPTAFGNYTSALASLPSRDLRSKDAAAITKYIEAKHDHLAANNFFTNLASLLENPELDAVEAEKLDALLVQSAFHAGKKCRSRRRDWWSNALTKQRTKTNILRRLMSGFKNNVEMRPVLEARLLQLQLTLELPLTAEACSIALRAAQQKTQQMVLKHRELRQEELESRAELHAMEGSANKQANVQAMNNKEQMSQIFSRIRSIRSDKSTRSHFTSLQVPNSWPRPGDEITNLQELPDPKAIQHDDTQWRTVELPSDVLYYLRLRNRLHFGQAQGTPFTKPPLSELIDWQASTKYSDMILEGDYDTEEIDDIQQLMLEHCQKLTELDSIDGHITTDQFESRLKVWREATTTSPSGVDLSHYKALVAKNDLDPVSTEADLLEIKRKQLIQAHVQLINYATTHRYSYERWKTIVNVMIQKEPGNSKIHRLRVIHIYEADFNLLIGVKWRELLHDATQINTLHPGQHGARPGHEATTPVFMEELKTDISYASHKSLINFDNDATSCYDRIITAIASILGRSHGLHRSIVFVHARTLREAKYKLKTLLGVSDEFYSHCKIFPIYGTGQGSANSPVIWTLVSSTLFHCHEQRGHGATFTSPDRTTSIHISMVGFVDDSTGQVNHFEANEQPSPNELAELMKIDAQLWSDLLWVSGGRLELPKCSYHQIHFDFLSDGTPNMRPGKVTEQIMISDPKTGLDIPITSKSVLNTHKTLGHYRAPAGTSKTQLNALKEKSKLMAKQASSSPISSRTALVFYQTIYLKSIGFVLPCSFFTAAQLHSIHSPAARVFASKCGYNRNTSLNILHGPTHLAGSGFLSLYTIQGEGQISMFLKFWRTQTPTSILLRTALAWTQYQSGTGTPLLTDVHPELPHLEPRWLPSLRNFLSSINATIELDTNYIPALQRQRDEHIMDRIISSKAFLPVDIKRINYCRMYLQISTVSDMCLADGIHLDPAIADGERSQLTSQSTWLHFHQGRPNEHVWLFWRRLVIPIWFNRHQELHNPLGPWLTTSDKLRRNWNSYYDRRRDFLYVLNEDTTYHQYDRPSLECDEFSFGISTTWTPDCYSLPVDAYVNIHGEYSIHQDLPTITPTTRPSQPSSFTDYLELLPPSERDLFQDLEMFYDCYAFIDLVSAFDPEYNDLHVQLYNVSDGSAFNTSMSFGWAMSLPDGTRLATCSGPAYGSKQSSFRAEGYGMLSLVRFIHHLSQYCDALPTWKIKLICDNEGLITRLKVAIQYTTSFPNDTLQPDWDLTNAIVTTLQATQLIPTFEHIKGHQDKHVDVSLLPLAAQLNCEADHEAVHHQTLNQSYRPSVPRLFDNQAQLHIDGSTINSSYRTAIRNATSEPALRKHIQATNKWTNETMSTIAWESHRQALNRMQSRHVQLVKLCHDILPTSKLVNRYNTRLPSSCHLCNHDIEDLNHLLQCQHPQRIPWRSQLYKAIRDACESFQTRESLVDVLIQGLDAWLSASPLDAASFPPALHPLIIRQNAIGWRQLFQGRFALEWSILQDQYLQEIGIYHSDTTGTLWVTRMIVVIWKQFFLMWEQRNQQVHGHDQTTQTTAKRHRLATEFKHLHSKRTDVLHTDRDLFIGTTDDEIDTFIESVTPKYIANWIQVWRPVILDSVKAAAAFALKSVPPLTTYFEPLRATTQSKRPPKPRYTKTAHTRNDGTDRVRRKRQRRAPARNYQITRFFSRRSKTIETRTPLPV
jgi:hypothetical protein